MSFLSDPPRPFFRRCIYDTVRWFSRFATMILFRPRAIDLKNIPKTGGMILCSNHQSNLDPIIIGSMSPRRLNYLAKKALFRFPLGWILTRIDCIPIDREGAGIGGMKETLRRLKRKESVLIFPEGARSDDGELQPVMRGFLSLARRSKLPLVPMAIEGAYQAWPRNRWYPLPGQIVMVVGELIPAETVAELSDDELIELLNTRLSKSFQRARANYRGNTYLGSPVNHHSKD